MKILTVGDGDLSFSLSLKRAYLQHIKITASTLIESPQELIRTYSNAVETIKELKDECGDDSHSHSEVLYGVDCCKLDTRDWKNSNQFDLIMFNHPHLGDATLYESEAHHAGRHHALLCHYFYSAAKLRHGGILSPTSGRVHVCLCGMQPKTWNLMKAARRHGWKCVLQEGTASPVHHWLFARDGLNRNLGQPQTRRQQGDDSTHSYAEVVGEIIEAATVQAHYPCPRKYRNGKLGSKHFLGRYGYRHRRTGGDLYGGNDVDMAVHQSINFIFEFMESEGADNDVENDCVEGQNMNMNVNMNRKMEDPQHHVCSICAQSFPTKAALHAHLEAPALPDIHTGNYLHAKGKKVIATDIFGPNQQVDGNEPEQASSQVTRAKVEQKSLDGPGSTRGSNPATLNGSNSGDVSTFECNPGPEITTQTMQILDEMKLAEAVVPNNYASKRLKWLCRQVDFHPFSKHIRSKKQCTDAIRDGRVCVNGTVARDSSRIVKEGDVLVLLKEGSAGGNGNDVQHPACEGSHASHDMVAKRPDLDINSNFGVELKKILPLPNRCRDTGNETTRLIVAYKPVGIRAVGQFSDRTLESITKSILERDPASIVTGGSPPLAIECTSITKLDTGCSGLCLLMARAMGGDASSHTPSRDTSAKTSLLMPVLHVTYHFTALVHGFVPLEWDDGVYVKLSGTESRRWKRQKTESQGVETTNNEMGMLEDNIHTTVTPQDLNDSLFLRCTDRYGKSTKGMAMTGNKDDDGSTQLSTVIIHSSRDAGRLSSVICYHLRKIGFPVVNDRFCKRELAALPRIMRNILKNKLCIGCFSLQVGNGSGDDDDKSEVVVSIEPHPRTQCSFWREQQTGGTT